MGSLVTSVELEALVSRLMYVVPKAGDLNIQQHVSKLSEATLVLQPQNPLCSLIAPTPGKLLAEVHLMRKSGFKSNILLELDNEKKHVLCCAWFGFSFCFCSLLL